MEVKNLEKLLRIYHRRHKEQKVEPKEAAIYISSLGGAKLVEYLSLYSKDIHAQYEYLAGLRSQRVYLIGSLKGDPKVELSLIGADSTQIVSPFERGRHLAFKATLGRHIYSLPTVWNDRIISIADKKLDEIESIEESVSRIKKIISLYDSVLKHLRK